MTKAAILERIADTLGEPITSWYADERTPEVTEFYRIMAEWRRMSSAEVIAEAESVFGWTD